MIRKIDQNGLITTVAGSGEAGLSGDGGPPTLARLDSPAGVAVDTAGNLYISDTNNHRVRKVTFALTVPGLERISATFAAQGASQTIGFFGTSFAAPLVINAGSGITVSDIQVASETLALAKLNIAPNAAIGPRTISVTTAQGTSSTVPFDVVPPYPDLSILISQAPRLEVGFNGTYTATVTNLGVAATTGPITVTSTLAAGLSFVSGAGTGWSCSASGQAVSCTSLDSVAPGDAAPPLLITVAVSAGVGSSVTHSVTVSGSGELITNNNSHAMVTSVLTPFLNFTFSPTALTPGIQATVGLVLSQTFTHDVSGTLTMALSSNAVHPADDPAIQFVTGGRTVNFTIPANTTQARFAPGNIAGPIAFQTGTVGGTLSFSVNLQTGTVQTPFGNTRTIPLRPPGISNFRTETISNGSFNVVLNSTVTTREVTSLVFTFFTTPTPTLSCGGVSGCTASGSALTLDVRSLFDNWFVGNPQFGGLVNLKVPLTITGTTKGSIQMSLRNTVGTSSITFPVP